MLDNKQILVLNYSNNRNNLKTLIKPIDKNKTNEVNPKVTPRI